ncbi:MAG TPA: protein kinase, partial [Holophaga sp.]|nr:protein kinase [Holophaga sp.]
MKEAARSGEPCLLEALLKTGALDDTDVEVLDRIPERVPERVPGAQASMVPQPAPEAAVQDRTAEPADGQEVRTCFDLERWKNYRDLRFVAEGGVGRIFAALDPGLKRTVALKFLRSDDPELARRFMLEAQRQARIEHPNICKVFEVGEWRGQAYLAMQFIQGETLERAAARMSLAEKIETLEVAAEAVHAAHREGLIHRDIKPAN